MSTLKYKAQDGTWKDLGGGAPTDPDAYIRPADWLPLPTPAAHQFVGLLAITNDEANYVALRATCINGYTVDWGDGQVTQHTSNTTAEHLYDYSAIPANTQSSRGYRQVVVKVYSTTGTNFVTVFSLQYKHSRTGLNAYNANWLDIAANLPNCTSIALGGTTVYLRLLEQATLTTSSLTSTSSMFNNCSSLRSVPLFTTTNVTNMSAMFQYCSTLRSVPLFDTAKVTNMTSMFGSCSALRTIPAFNTSQVTTMSGMFSSCPSLLTIPMMDTSKVTDMSSMFSGCYALQSVPALNTAALSGDASLTNIFTTCASLASAPLQGTKMSISYANCKLSAAALNAIYAGLGSAVLSKTITVTGNFGIDADDPSIATNKGGWTVTGS